MNYVINTIDKSTTLHYIKIGENIKYYRTYDSAIYDVMIDVFNIDTDISEYMINQPRGPSLPDHREELKYITSVVGDMPGGIVSILPIIHHVNELSGNEDYSVLLKDEDSIVDWAMQIGNILNEYPVQIIDNIPNYIILDTTPAIIWEIEIAAQEGIASLRFIADVGTGQVWVEKTYRLYGSTRVNQQFYTTENKALFDILCEISFGKAINIS